MGIEVSITGKSCHASMPERGVNPFSYLPGFLEALKSYPHAYSELYGSSTITPTKIVSSEAGTNTVPAMLQLYLDYRSIPGESYESIVRRVQQVAQGCRISGISIAVRVITFCVSCYTGLQEEVCQAGLPFGIEEQHAFVQECRALLQAAYERDVHLIHWPFCTDCGHFENAGISTIGFAPSKAACCHISNEYIDIDMLGEGLIGYLALAQGLCR